MDLEQMKRMALLEATLRAVRRLNSLAKADPTSVSIDDAMDGRLSAEWSKIKREIDMLVP